MENNRKIEVCFSPVLFEYSKDINSIVVIVDALRATSAICTAFAQGVEKIIPVASLEEAKEYKKKGYMVAAERDGIVQDFADFGNSPFNFTAERVKGKTVVYSTTNGTQAITMASDCYRVIVGSFLNLTAMSDWMIKQNRDVIVLCAGWKNKFNLEDTVLAGAVVENLLNSKKYYTICDSANASLDLWNIAKHDLVNYIDKVAQRSRLRKLGLDDVIEYCFTPDQTDVIPILSDGSLVNNLKMPE